MTPSKSEGDPTPDVQTELDRLNRLRRDVAAGLLVVSKSAKHDAETLLAAYKASNTLDHETGGDHIESDAVQPAGESKARLYGTFGLGLAVGLVVSMLFGSFGGESPSVNSDAAEHTPEMASPSAAATEPTPVPPPPAAPDAVVDTRPEPAAVETPADPTDGLVVSINASGECWISAELDGSGAPMERTLSRNDEIVLEAEEEVVLTISDPSAISMSINGRPTRSLGAAGRVTHLRITPANFRDLLNN